MAMSERVDTARPSQADFDQEVEGLNWERFQQLPDAEVTAIQRRLARRALTTFGEPTPDATDEVALDQHDRALMDHWSEAVTFRQFLDWRRYGIPDRDVMREDVVQYMQDSVAARLVADPEYGQLPAAFQQLSAIQRGAIREVFGYFLEMRAPYEYLVIDNYSLTQTIGLDKGHIESLVKHGVLSPVGEDPMAGDTYQLSGAYYDYWLARRFRPKEEA